jgi:hypothetical protein
MESNQLILPNSLLATIGTTFQVGALRAFRGPAHVARTSTPRIDVSPHDTNGHGHKMVIIVVSNRALNLGTENSCFYWRNGDTEITLWA